MLCLRSLLVAGLAGLATAASIPSSSPAFGRRADAGPNRLLVTYPGNISLVDFDGMSLKQSANFQLKEITPSWVAYADPGKLYTFNENSNVILAYSLDLKTNKLNEEKRTEACKGPVHALHDKDKNRLIISCYTDGNIAIMDVSDNNLKVLKTITTGDDKLGPGQTTPRSHMTVMEPSGRFYATMNLGTDTILLLDSKNDAWNVVNHVRVDPAGCGPRHGAFYPPEAEKATHFTVVCETLNFVLVFKLTYQDDKVEFKQVNKLSTFAENTKANITNARAGELILSSDGKDMYVTNRLTKLDIAAPDTDSIGHFSLTSSCSGDLDVKFIEEVPTDGVSPRMISLRKDQNVMFVANSAAGKSGLAALTRAADGGKLTPKPVATTPFLDYYPNGPQFVQQIV